MLLFINEIDFKAFGPFNDVDGTDVKLFRAMFRSYERNKRRKKRIPVNKIKQFHSPVKIIYNNIAVN